MQPKLRMLAAGWYGAPNAGDELLLAVLREQASASDVELAAISVDPEQTRALHGMDAVDFHNLGAIANAMLDTDLFIMGGGGIFQDHNSFHLSPLFDPTAPDIAAYARLFFMARQLGLRTVLWGQGIGPLRSDDAKMVVRAVYTQADYVSVRDEASASLLRELGVEREVLLGTDPAWLATPARKPAARTRKADVKILGMVLREWSPDPGWRDTLVQSVRELVRPPWRCRLVGFQPRAIEGRVISDLPLLEGIRDELEGVVSCDVVGAGTPREAVRQLRSCDAVVSMRLHGTMMALASRVPTAAIEYDAKMSRMNDMVGLDAVARVRPGDSAQAFAAMLASVISQPVPPVVTARILNKMRAGARVHVDMLKVAFDDARAQPRAKRPLLHTRFDWLACWLQQSIWSYATLAQQHEQAVGLLKYRDQQLAELDREAHEAIRAQATLAGQHSRDMDLLKYRDQQLAEFEREAHEAIRAQATLAGQHSRDMDLLKYRDQQLAELEREAHEAIRAQATLAGQHSRDMDLLKYRDHQLAELERDVRDAIRAQASLTEQHNRAVDLLKYRDYQVGELENHRLELQRTRGVLAQTQRSLDSAREELALLQSTVATQGGSIHGLESYVQDKEVYIAQLQLSLVEAQRGFWPRLSALKRPIRALPRRSRVAWQILRAGGPRSLFQALRARRLSDANARGLAETPAPAPPSVPGPAAPEELFTALQNRELVLFASLSYEGARDCRHAQFADAAIATGRSVVYIHASSEESDGWAVPTPGMRSISLAHTTPVDVFEQVSARACVVVACVDPRAIAHVQLARKQGLDVILDLEVPGSANQDTLQALVGMVERCTAASTQAAAELKAAGARNVTLLPEAASHVQFDIYRIYPLPPGMGVGLAGAVCKRVVAYFPGGTQRVDWSLLDRLCASRRSDQFYVVGPGARLSGCPDNLHCIGMRVGANAAAWMSAADLVVLPCTEHEQTGLHPQDGLGAYAGVFMGKPIVSNVAFEVPTSPLMTVCVRPDDFIEQCGALLDHPPASDMPDDFVMGNAWLSRLEVWFNEQGRKNVSVIVLIHNNADIIGRCLRSMLMHVKPYLAELVVVDNASSDGGAEYVEKEFPDVLVVRNKENGCASGRNLGACHCTGEYIAFFDSDQWLVGGAGFAEAIAVLEHRADVGTVGWNAGWFDPAREDLGGPIADYFPRRAMNDAALREGFRTDIGFLGTSGMFLRRRLFEQLEGFDTYYDPTCFEDTDLCFQIRQCGLRVAFRDLSGIRHQPHQTTGANSGSRSYWKLFNRNADYFREKWKAHPEFFLHYTP